MEKILKKSLPKKQNYIYHVIFLISIFLAGLLIFFSFKKNNNCNQQFLEIAKIIEKIDKKCKILCFIDEHNPINFLNVKEFSGNTIGSIQISDPKKWEGPYLNEVPFYGEKPISIFVHQSGVYLVPGNGTSLDNGKIIGKDIVFDKNFNEENLIKTFPELTKNGKKLICKINIDFKLPEKI